MERENAHKYPVRLRKHAANGRTFKGIRRAGERHVAKANLPMVRLWLIVSQRLRV
jgi:hypothetical protein